MIVHQVFVVTVLSLFVDAVRVQYPSVTETQINSRIGAFLAQSADRDGGRKDRGLKKPTVLQASTDSAAGVSHVDLSDDRDVEDD